MDDSYWKEMEEKENAFNKVISNPLFNDKYDTWGNEIFVGDNVSSIYTYRLMEGFVIPIRGKVMSISSDGVEVKIQNRPGLKPITVPGGALRIERKKEMDSASSVWRMQNALGRGPYTEKQLFPEEQPEDVRGVLYKDTENVFDSNLELFLHLEPRKDLSIGIKIFGWIEGEPINKHERFAYNVDTSKMLFGFLSEEQANAWFSEEDRKALSRFGYSLVEVKAAKIIAKSGHQCVYIPA